MQTKVWFEGKSLDLVRGFSKFILVVAAHRWPFLMTGHIRFDKIPSDDTDSKTTSSPFSLADSYASLRVPNPKFEAFQAYLRDDHRGISENGS